MSLSAGPGAEQGSGSPEALLKVSPYHPYARAILIEKDWEKVKDQAAAWEKEPADSPAVLAALGRHYSDTKKYDEAQRVLSRYIELSPDLWAYQTLAANFKAQGKIDRWQADSRRVPGQGGGPGPGSRQGPRRDRQLLHGPEAVGQGQAVCGSRGADVGRVGDGLRGPLRRGRERLGACGSLVQPGRAALSRR